MHGKRLLCGVAALLALASGCGSTADAGAAGRADDIPRLVELLKVDDWTTASRAADDLGELGTKALPAVPALAQALRHPVPVVQHSAARALGDIGPGAAPAIPDLRETFAGNDYYLMVEAAVAWQRIDPANQQSVPRLAALTGYGHPDIRLRAARALGGMGETARAAVPALTERLHDEDQGVRDAATAALAAITGAAGSGRAPRP